MMKMNNREEIYSYLKQYDREYSLAKNSEERDRIENNVRNFAEGLDDEIYLELNNNAASGLFAPGFFESDMDKSLRQLQNVRLQYRLLDRVIMEMIGIVKRQAVIVLLFICFFPTMAVAQVSQFKLKQVLQDANAGDISACAYLGKMYYEGTGVAQNYNEAFKWYQKAADNGVTGAYIWLGVMYYNGQGVAQNYEKAFLWSKKAAENGAADAYVGLGTCG